MASSIEIIRSAGNLYQADDSIWYCREQEPISYPEEGNQSCFQIEEKSFWFQHRNVCIHQVFDMFSASDQNVFFDVGGGNGFVSKYLEEKGIDTVLVEPGESGVINAKNRGLENVVCSTTDAANFRPSSMPAIGLFDVLEHIENDLAFLRSIHTLLSDHGQVYLTVPSSMALWSEEDILAGHFRRYTNRTITEVFEEAGFKVEFVSNLFSFLPIPIWVSRVLPYKLGKRKGHLDSVQMSKDHVVSGNLKDLILNKLRSFELNRIRNCKSLRWGSSLLVVASKAL